MGIYTNKGIVNHAKKALALKTKYMWGGILRTITPAYIDTLLKMYPQQYSTARVTSLKKLDGQGYFGVDCVGLIKSYYWSGQADGGTGSPKYAGSTDINAGAMFEKARAKGSIATMPETPGLILYSKTHPHVGVYIGNGETIESTLGSRGDGVVKRKLDSFWEYWFECPYIDYITDNSAATSSESKESFSVGDKVKIKQSATTYADSTIKIPDIVKGKPYTIDAIKPEKARLQPINSWVYIKDVEN